MIDPLLSRTQHCGQLSPSHTGLITRWAMATFCCLSMSYSDPEGELASSGDFLSQVLGITQCNWAIRSLRLMFSSRCMCCGHTINQPSMNMMSDDKLTSPSHLKEAK